MEMPYWENDRLRCDHNGKRCHVTEGDAERQMYTWWRNARSGEKRAIHSYRCPHCGYWHLTSMTQQAWESSAGGCDEPVDG